MRHIIIALAASLLSLGMGTAAFSKEGTVPEWATHHPGEFLDFAGLKAEGLPDQRLTIWLPPGYHHGKKRYPVLYMHDGHNLFDPATSNFNKVWHADIAMEALVRTHRAEPHIIVGIWAPGQDRYRQYLPKPIYDAASPALRSQMDRLAGGPIISDVYLKWIADQLKPWVDTRFRTRSAPNETSIVGSSMGGLMSCYAFMVRPDVFGRAACVSSHWPSVDPREVGATNMELQALLTGWFRQSLGAPGHRRLWMDHGTATLDAAYAPYQRAIDAEISSLGWHEGRNFESRVYEGAPHDENAWSARLEDILAWLFASTDKTKKAGDPSR